MQTKKNLKQEVSSLQNKIGELNQQIQYLLEDIETGATIECFEDKAGEWRWRYKAANGRISFPSGQGFTKGNCMRSARRLQELLGGTDAITIVEVSDETEA